MSHKRSGLLRGLIIGLIAALLTAAAYGTWLFYRGQLPYDVRWLGGGIVLPAAGAFAVGLVIALAHWAARARSLFLPFTAALYALAAMVLGWIGGHTAFNTIGIGFPVETIDTFLDILKQTASMTASLFLASPDHWRDLTIAAGTALLLTLLRVLRLRRRARLDQGAAAEKPPADQEADYRAPFEPLQAAKPATAPPNLFSPPDRGEA
ncbi:hypothetical protein LDL08_13460 [Nonomuraea glycinis]|uniref:Uncharacterized protein n=1 Tax=Nonomuraea glycinis TaxID=2047744 RepID=A0A918A5W3_9ACTN|nr:hypothetical protein [Nonomuraea glycinis]MCA2177189.1 hypothetical protein [Nonomuraea glycinis]GGP08844.1 hypothetical protein GCM10012278_41910 [Nonomuraea glycinis]